MPACGIAITRQQLFRLRKRRTVTLECGSLRKFWTTSSSSVFKSYMCLKTTCSCFNPGPLSNIGKDCRPLWNIFRPLSVLASSKFDIIERYKLINRVLISASVMYCFAWSIIQLRYGTISLTIRPGNTERTQKLRCSLTKFVQTLRRENSQKAQQYREQKKKIIIINKDGSMVRYIQNLRTTYLAPWTVPYQRTALQFNF